MNSELDNVPYFVMKYRSYGLLPEDVENTIKSHVEVDSNGNYYFKLKISVPKDTHITDENGNKLCGEYLAKKFKDDFNNSLTMTSVKVFYKVRDEIWDRTKEEHATALVLASFAMIKDLKNRGIIWTQ